MSVFQSKKTLISAEPRPVAERTVTDPGMSFIASSIGRVIVAIISSAGMTPLSTRTMTRGKSVCGKTEDGSVSAAQIPATQSATQRKTIAAAWRVAMPARALRTLIGDTGGVAASPRYFPMGLILVSFGNP